MRHSYGLTIGLHFRQHHYTRGQSGLAWILSVQRGAVTQPDHNLLQHMGGHKKDSYWVRATVLGLSLQVGIERAVSSWTPRKRP